MTDKKRCRPTVKKTEEKTIAMGRLPPARFCLSYLAQHKDEITAYREKHGDDTIIREYESLHDAETLSALYRRATAAIYDRPPDSWTIPDLLVTIPFTASLIAHSLSVMGAAYYDIILGRESK